MAKHYLCSTHREWLFSHPKAANASLADNQETGLFYRDRQMWDEALPYLGCAWETAEILLTTKALEEVHAVITFTSSAVLLADTYQRASRQQESLQIFQQAQGRLHGELALSYQQPELQHCIIECIKALGHGASRPDYRQMEYSAAIH